MALHAPNASATQRAGRITEKGAKGARRTSSAQCPSQQRVPHMSAAQSPPATQLHGRGKQHAIPTCSCVVLPAPLTPTSPARSPFFTSQLMSLSTCWFLKVIATWRRARSARQRAVCRAGHPGRVVAGPEPGRQQVAGRWKDARWQWQRGVGELSHMLMWWRAGCGKGEPQSHKAANGRADGRAVGG